MQTELDRIRLRTSHRFWPAVLFLPVPIVLIMLLLFFGLKPLPMVTPPPVDLQTCSGWEAAESTCDPLMSEWILQLPTREQYLAWTAHDIYEDVAAELPADVAPDVARQALLDRRDAVMKATDRAARHTGWLATLPTAHPWDQAPPAPPAHLADALDVEHAMKTHGDRYEMKRTEERMSRAQDVAAWQGLRRYQFRQAMETNSAAYVLQGLGALVLLGLFGFILRVRPKDVVLTPHELRIGRRRIPLRDIDRVDVDDNGATIRLHRGRKIRISVDNPAMLLEFLPELEAALARRAPEAQALPEPPAVDEDLAALRGQTRARLREKVP